MDPIEGPPAREAAVLRGLARLCENAVRPGPLTADERAAVEAGIRRCYELAGLTGPEHIVWTASPSAVTESAVTEESTVPSPDGLRERFGARLRRRGAARPGPFGRRPRVAPVSGVGGASHATWLRIEEELRRTWLWASWPLSQPGVLPGEGHDPLARMRSAIDSAHSGRGPSPAPRFDGAFDGRLTLMTLLTNESAASTVADHATRAAFAAASGAGPWWPGPTRAVVCERPVAVHAEALGRRPPFGYRLHCDDGPSLRWADGTRLYHFHGIEVPAELIESGWHGAAVHRHPNSEVRRAGIERIGWARYIAEAGWRQVAAALDPGNPPHQLELYEDPSGRADLRVLVMTNGSPDRSGSPRRYAETVPARFTDPVEAAAWQYGCPVRVYRRLKRRT